MELSSFPKDVDYITDNEYLQSEILNLNKLNYWSKVSQKVHFPKGIAESFETNKEDIPQNRYKKQRVERLERKQNNCNGVSQRGGDNI